VAAHSEDFVILACTVLIGLKDATDGRTDTSTTAKTRESLHAVARNKTASLLVAAAWNLSGKLNGWLRSEPIFMAIPVTLNYVNNVLFLPRSFHSDDV